MANRIEVKLPGPEKMRIFRAKSLFVRITTPSITMRRYRTWIHFGFDFPIANQSGIPCLDPAESGKFSVYRGRNS